MARFSRRGVRSQVPVYYVKARRRWMFQLRRTVAGKHIRTAKLLPAAWGRAEAEAFDRAETARIFGLAAGTRHESPLIELAVLLYLEHHKTARNIHRCRGALAQMLPAYEGKTFDDLPKLASDYANQHPELKPGTIRNRLAYLRAACRWAWKHQNMGQSDPGARMAMPSVHNERRVYLTLPDVHQLAKACHMPATAAIVRLAFYTGLRWVAELLPRQPADIKRENGITWLNVGTTKNGSPRMVPVHPEAVPDLKRLPFTLHWRTYYSDFEQAREKIGRPDVRMHDLRHSLASAILSGGNTLGDVQAALGHASAQSAKRYAHLYPERLQQVIWQLGGRKIANRKSVKNAKKAA